MPFVVLIAELATFGLITLFCLLLADGLRSERSLFDIPGADGVGRTLIRSAQLAFAVGLPAVVLLSIFGPA